MREALYDSYKNIIGYMEQIGDSTYVYDSMGLFRGKANDQRTEDAGGFVVAYSNIPTLLLKSQKPPKILKVQKY